MNQTKSSNIQKIKRQNEVGRVWEVAYNWSNSSLRCILMFDFRWHKIMILYRKSSNNTAAQEVCCNNIQSNMAV